MSSSFTFLARLSFPSFPRARARRSPALCPRARGTQRLHTRAGWRRPPVTTETLGDAGEQVCFYYSSFKYTLHQTHNSSVHTLRIVVDIRLLSVTLRFGEWTCAGFFSPHCCWLMCVFPSPLDLFAERLDVVACLKLYMAKSDVWVYSGCISNTLFVVG